MTERTPHQPERDAQRQRMAEASGISDREILADLQAVGYTPDTVSLLHLAPVVEVAWAGGQITNGERAMILGTAATLNVQWESPAHYQLLDWIASRPSSAFFETSRWAVRSALHALPANERAARRRDLISSCRNVAVASAEILGIGREICDAEQRLIDRLVVELQCDDESLATGEVA